MCLYCGKVILKHTIPRSDQKQYFSTRRRPMKKTLFLLAILMTIYSCGGGGESTPSPPLTDGPANPPIKNPPDTSTIVTKPNPKCIQDTLMQATLGQEIFKSNCQLDDTATVTPTSDGTNLFLTLKIYPKNPVFSYGFYLAYDPTVIQYGEYQQTDFLGWPQETYLDVAEMMTYQQAAGTIFHGCNAQPSKKSVTISHTRLGNNVGGVYVNNPQGTIIGTIRFTILKKQPTEITFAEPTISERLSPGAPIIQKDSCWPQKINIGL